MRSANLFAGSVALLFSLSSAWAEIVIAPKLAAPLSIPAGELLLTELNCTACHSPGEKESIRDASRKSPLLGKSGMRITPQYLRAYLADPARSKPGTTMPDMLHDLEGTEKKETVDALVHFLISEQSTAKVPGTAAEEYQVRRGRVLYHTIGCVACHEPQAAPDIIPGISPDDPRLEQYDPSLRGPASIPLGDLARKTTVDQLASFLMDPLATRPSGRMPSHNLSKGEATSIAVYLLRAQAAGLKDSSRRELISGLRYQYYEESFGGSPDFDALTPKESGTVPNFDVSKRKRDQFFGFRYSGSIEIPRDGDYTFFLNSDDGSQLFIDGKLVVDNNGEHAPQERRGSIQLKSGRYPLVLTFYNNGAGYELKASWRGPGMEKQEIPSTALMHYGQPMVPLGEDPQFAVDPAKARKGRELFANLGCASCHSRTSVPPSQSRAMELAALSSTTSGCMAENPPAGVPRFAFSPEQRAALRSTLAKPAALFREQTAEARVAHTTARLNCLACHTRNAQGGPTNPRLDYFRTAGDIDMGDEGRIPPHLTAVGGKLRPEWMKEVLMNSGRVRPYMATRMPQFGAEQVGHLPADFEKADLKTSARPAPEFEQRDAKYGRRLAGANGLSCIACHTLAPHKALGIPAIDLTVMTKRLRYDWFHRYLIDPPSLRPGTRMPSFWPDGRAVNTEVLDGNTDAQIKSLWAYLESNPAADIPAGLVQGKMEIVPETEPVIYRNFIAGGGTRAIGVGYPERVHLAFDANNLRLAMVWQGAFIDAARHSTGRGDGFEPPLGNNVIKFPEGPQVAALANAEAPWPAAAERSAGYSMGGYRFDGQRRATFFYVLGDVRVEESFLPVMGEIDAYFKRTLRFTGSSSGAPLWFRAAAGQIEKNGTAFILDERVQMKFTGARPVLRDNPAGGQELLLPVNLENGSAVITQEIIW